MARKIKTVIVENGFEREVEIEVPDGPPASWGDISKLRILGKRNPRVEGPLKVTGKAKYASDVVLPGMCYGRYLMSPYAAATLESLDLAPAQAIPGVKAVLRLKNDGAAVMFHGEPVAAVAALTPEIAEDALRAIKAAYQVKPHVVDPDKAMAANAPRVRSDTQSNLQGPGENRNGNVDAAFQECAAIIENTYEAQTRLHCCLETHGATVKWDGGKLTIWASTQDVGGVRNQAGGQAGGAANVSVICEHMGGGFGSKFGLGPEGDTCVKLAKAANAPVKFLLTRAEEQLANYRGPGVKAKVKLGATREGVFRAAVVETWNNGGVGNAGTPLDGAHQHRRHRGAPRSGPPAGGAHLGHGPG
jgi:xanthine dehydrogenase YagR molybdenum-binding subunit